ncbi:MAG: DUF4185 domain-containing protein [Elusimicrobia bacterium]|nr:DUF4185 domain-containing protein [Elusimicrobiota bacterium]
MQNIYLPVFLFCSMATGAVFGETVNEGIFAPSRLDFVLGQDGVTPIPVIFKDGEKKYLWTFGDTMLGAWKGPVVTTATLNFAGAADTEAMPCNTLALSAVPAETNYKELRFKFYTESSTVSEFIKYNKNENPFINRLWADSGIQTDSGVYVFYMDVEIAKENAAGFKFKGTGLAKAKTPEKADILEFNFERVGKFYAKDILLGDSVVKKGGYVYILGRIAKKADGSLNALCAARVEPARIEDFSAYEFLSRKGRWQKKEKGAFFDDVSGEASLVYDEGVELFRIVYMSGRTQDIRLVEFGTFNALARKPSVKSVYKPEPKKDIFYYSAKEIFHSKETVRIIYIDPSIYQPILVKYSKPVK